MKEPIEASEIRKGDLIRFEYANDTNRDGSIAYEFVATRGDSPPHFPSGQLFLLHRPQPDVLVPGAAIEALRAENKRASALVDDGLRSVVRRDAIYTFLDAVDRSERGQR